MQNASKPAAHHHENYAAFSLLSFLIPIVGFILGIVYLTKTEKIDKKLGEHMVVLSIIGSVVMSAGWYYFARNYFTLAPQPIVTAPAVIASPEPSTPVWDANSAYEKVTNGMSKDDVAAAIGRQPISCTESQYMDTRMEVCVYGNAITEKVAITVTFTGGKVSNKVKSTY